MFVNKLNQLYKPDRILYYKDATPEELKAYYKGEVPGEIARYGNAFGTYDLPGAFFLKSLNKEVIGIEFRKGDDRIDYPKDLQSVELGEIFFYSIEIDDEIELNRDRIRDFAELVEVDNDAHRAYSDLRVKMDFSEVGIFADGKKIRILIELDLISDFGKHIIKDEVEFFDKEYLYNAAFHDVITGHYNWNHIVPYLEVPKDCGVSDYAFVHFDIKEFKVVNEVYGHAAANRLLIKVVNAMNNADFVYASARCHNDNFCMMIKDMPLDETLETLQKFFDDLMVFDEDPGYKVYFRCGVVPMKRTMLSGNRVADAGKMAQALGRKHNKTEIIVYNDRMHDDISWGNFIKAYVETAIEKDEFEVYLQPKFDIRNDAEIEGAEALIRWNYKSKELLPPSKFVPFFEKDGSIGKIDDVVLNKVCGALAKWKEEGKTLYPISVNLSRNRLYDIHLVDHLTEIVDSYNVDHALIDFELTESATYDNTQHMCNLMEEFRKRGFRISMDDFGTGYSSLSLLTQMPFDTLKIDKCFVDKVSDENQEDNDITVLRHIITLARELGFVCLADGAENKEQVEKLKKLGCQVIQGFYYSKPMSLPEFEKRFL